MNTDGAAVPEDEKPAEMPSAADIVSFRVEALREAARIISNDRNGQYGDPEDNFGKIAELWTALFGRKFSREDVALAFIATKLARIANPNSTAFQPDSWIDIAGYAGCGYEVGKLERN
jgi:hypothetical protein